MSTKYINDVILSKILNKNIFIKRSLYENIRNFTEESKDANLQSLYSISKREFDLLSETKPLLENNDITSLTSWGTNISEVISNKIYMLSTIREELKKIALLINSNASDKIFKNLKLYLENKVFKDNDNTEEIQYIFNILNNALHNNIDKTWLLFNEFDSLHFLHIMIKNLGTNKTKNLRTKIQLYIQKINANINALKQTSTTK